MQPEGVDIDGLLVFELKSPLSTMLVLKVLPLGADAGFEEVVVGLLSEYRGRSDVILNRLVRDLKLMGDITHVDAPEFFD
jgi:hypothetical protein